MKFEVGKDYKGRDGRKLTVLDFAPETYKSEYTMVVYDHMSGSISSHTEEGAFIVGTETENDIIGEWKEPRTCKPMLIVLW